jgi:hypothetical protein
LHREAQEDLLADSLSRQAVTAQREDQEIPVDLQQSLRQCFFAPSARDIVIVLAWHLSRQLNVSQAELVIVAVKQPNAGNL